MEIINFYNQGAQVQIPTAKTDMTHTFSGGGDGDPKEIGYEPKANSKLAEGAAHDTLDYDGHTYLLLKGGHVYSVKIGDSEETETISAEEGNIALVLNVGTEVEVKEYEPPAPGEGSEGEQVDTTDPDANATEDAGEGAPEGEGTLGNEEGDQTPPIEE